MCQSLNLDGKFLLFHQKRTERQKERMTVRASVGEKKILAYGMESEQCRKANKKLNRSQGGRTEAKYLF